MRSTAQKMPLVAVVAPPRGGKTADHFAVRIRAMADRLAASGLALIATHGGDSDSPTVVVETDANHPAHVAAFGLVERAAELLRQSGLSTEFGRRNPPDVDPWAVMRKQHADSSYPVVEIYVPARFGRMLMMSATRALQPLRREGVLLVAMTSHFYEVAEEMPGRQQNTQEEIVGAPV